MEQAMEKQMNNSKVEKFVHSVVNDMSACMSGMMTNIGHKLGLYKAMAGAGAVSSSELAKKTRTNERYIREWLNNQAAGGYINYDPKTDKFEMPDEHAIVLANESPFFLAPGFDVVSSIWMDEEKIKDAFKSGNGVGWHEHHHNLFFGTESFFRPGYKANLTTHWIPALEGVEEKLKKGAKVADVGCGHGASTIIMAQAYPNSKFYGFDYHDKSIKTAKKRAEEASVSNRVKFKVASAKDFNGEKFDLVCFMDCFHDLGDPLGAATHTKEVLAKDGTILMVEPFANDNLEQNLNPIGRLFYAASASICVPNSLSQEVGTALGAQAGEKRLSGIVKKAGFKTFRRATETPFNIVFEAKP